MLFIDITYVLIVHYAYLQIVTSFVLVSTKLSPTRDKNFDSLSHWHVAEAGLTLREVLLVRDQSPATREKKNEISKHESRSFAFDAFTDGKPLRFFFCIVFLLNYSTCPTHSRFRSLPHFLIVILQVVVIYNYSPPLSNYILWKNRVTELDRG